MDEIEIEKGIPLPRARKRSKFPFAEMQVGDSILVLFEAASLSGRTMHIRPKKFTYRTCVGEEAAHAKGRVWRTE